MGPAPGTAQRALCQACLTNSAVSQRDAASDKGQRSGVGIRASKCTCVPPRNGRGREEQLGEGYEVQGSVAVLESPERWWHRLKKKKKTAHRQKKAGTGVA